MIKWFGAKREDKSDAGAIAGHVMSIMQMEQFMPVHYDVDFLTYQNFTIYMGLGAGVIWFSYVCRVHGVIQAFSVYCFIATGDMAWSRRRCAPMFSSDFKRFCGFVRLYAKRYQWLYLHQSVYFIGGWSGWVDGWVFYGRNRGA